MTIGITFRRMRQFILCAEILWRESPRSGKCCGGLAARFLRKRCVNLTTRLMATNATQKRRRVSGLEARGCSNNQQITPGTQIGVKNNKNESEPSIVCSVFKSA